MTSGGSAESPESFLQPLGEAAVVLGAERSGKLPLGWGRLSSLPASHPPLTLKGGGGGGGSGAMGGIGKGEKKALPIFFSHGAAPEDVGATIGMAGWGSFEVTGHLSPCSGVSPSIHSGAARTCASSTVSANPCCPMSANQA